MAQQQHFLLRAFARVVRIAEEEETGRGAEKDAAMPDLDAARQIPADGQILATGLNTEGSIWRFRPHTR